MSTTGRLKSPKHPQDLVEWPTLVLTTNAGPRNEWRLGETVVRVRRYHECTDSEVIRKWLCSVADSPIGSFGRWRRMYAKVG